MKKMLKVRTNSIIAPKPLEDNAEAILKEGTNKINIPYWLSAGTALGLYRDKDFIKGDTDIDIAVEGYDGIEFDIILNLDGFSAGRIAHYNGKPMQVAFTKDNIVFDVYIHWLEEANLVNHNDRGKTVMKKEICRNTIMIDTKYGTYPFPNPIEEYLKIRYGVDWETPQNKKPIFL